MSATAHQRRRRNAAAKRAAELQHEKDEQGYQLPPDTETDNVDQDAENEAQDSQATETTPASHGVMQDGEFQQLKSEDIDGMNVDELKGWLDAMDVKYAHNTGADKLRERLHNEHNKS